ncbi:profilin-1 [Chanos chanos]|uniref:Profilin n=1 Tax=Chanos chanos TaxID=29144 RepID=A0A6J2VIS8_CHACN|nr:profilin-2-like [Chanos chanos]
MSWAAYVQNLMDENVQDAAIVGHEAGSESIWASHPGGQFAKITPSEIKALMASDRTSMFTAGVTLAGAKCTVLRDNFHIDNTMDLRTKATEQDSNTYNISIGKSLKALVFVKGVKDAHGGKLNPKVHKIAEYLRSTNY